MPETEVCIGKSFSTSHCEEMVKAFVEDRKKQKERVQNGAVGVGFSLAGVGFGLTAVGFAVPSFVAIKPCGMFCIMSGVMVRCGYILCACPRMKELVL